MSTQTGKDTIYIDVDDEITTIIDKVRGSEQRIVALVLPKRATVLQSIVNMKLLKRTADGAKKHLVLITSESSLLPLAGAVGLYVAKSLQSKPEVPNAPAGAKDLDDAEESVDMHDAAEDVKLDKARPVGEYAAASGAAALNGSVIDDDEQPIELDNSTPDASPAAKTPKAKKDKKLKIPNFNKFRMLLGLGALGVVGLIFLLYIVLSVMPRASILVKTDSTAIETNLDITFDATAKETDVDRAEVPSVIQQSQKTLTQPADATGQKDKGEKASGTVTIKNCTDNPVTVPAGTGVSTNGLTFTTQDSLSLDSGNFSGSGVCKPSGGHVRSVDVLAQNAGDKYNVPAGSSYTLAGYPSGVTASGSAMTGGTSNIVKVVSQADIDSATQKLNAQDTTAVKSELKQALQGQGLMALDSTLSSANPEVTASAKAGDEADSVTVTQKVTYTMLGVKESDLKKLIAHEVNKHIDPTKQEILDYGLAGATFKLQNQQGTTTLATMSDTAIAGSDLNLTDLKKQVVGKKSNDVKEIIEKNPGVTDVAVHYSPFWVSSTPKKTSKITITVEKPAIKNAQ